MSLEYEARKNTILEMLDAHGKITVKDLSEKFNVSTETVRRDLETLEKENLLKKVYGGAIKIAFDHFEPPYINRQVLNAHEKKLIGKKAAQMINDHDVISIDHGTTTMEIVHHLKNKKSLTVLVNSIPALSLLTNYKNQKIFSGKIVFLGGEIDSEQMLSCGPITEKILDKFYVDKTFVAVGGMTMEYGLTGYDINQSNLSKKLMENAKEVIIVADHTKIGVRNFYKIADMDRTDVIICNKTAPKNWRNELKNKCIEWITA